MAQGTGRGASTSATVLFMLAAVGCAAGAAWVLAGVLERKYSRDPVQPIVVVAAPVPAGQPLQAKALRLAEWPKSAIPEGAFSRIEDAVAQEKAGAGGSLGRDRVPLIPLVRGAPLLRSHLSEPRAGIGIAARLEVGMRAVAVPCASAVRLARLVYPGARVDVLSTIKEEDAAGQMLLKTRVVLQDVKVLAVGEDIDPVTISERRARAANPDADGAGTVAQDDGEAATEREARGIVTLLVTPEETAIVTLAVRDGDVDLALRHPDDRRRREPGGAGVSRLSFLAEELGATPGAPQVPAVAAGGPNPRSGGVGRPRGAGGRERRPATIEESAPIRILRSSGGE